MFRRLLGVIILLVSLILVGLLLVGAYFVGQTVDSVGESFDNVLALTLDTLDNVSQTLEQTKSTVSEANNALDTASGAAVNLALTMNDMQPLLESTTMVVSQDVPSNIEAIQSTIPNITQVAGVIDGVLTTLSDFGIKQTIPIPFNPIELEFDLGIEYEPDEPFDQSIMELGDSLEGMPEELRSLQGDLDTLAEDLDMLTGDIESASGDIDKINEEVALFIPILDEYLRIVAELSDSLYSSRAQVFAQLETMKTALTVLLVFLSLTQLAPLYLGWELITGQRSTAPTQDSMQGAPPSVVTEIPEKEPPPPFLEDSGEQELGEERVESETLIEADEIPEASLETHSQEMEQAAAAETVVEETPASASEAKEEYGDQYVEGEEDQA